MATDMQPAVEEGYDRSVPIGDRPLTEEERGYIDLLGFSEEVARKYSTEQLAIMANDWYDVYGLIGTVYLGC